jgi:prepilin-type N-terminal cleavage/methylation domain-containing protein
MRPPKAFTLIELLIVVAIIAILAAIAVPNFLEAQVRAKVSRNRSDLRTYATAMEAYYVDNNRYPPDSDNSLLDEIAQRGSSASNLQTGFMYLTTPVAFLTSLPTDPFQSQTDPNGRSGAIFFELGSGSDNAGWSHGWGNQSDDGAPVVQSWMISGVGPDKDDQTVNNDAWPGRAGGISVALNTYDPTNGTISQGDIYRAGGQLNTGRYFVNGREFGPINQ